MNVLGACNAAAFSAEPDIKHWTDTIALNPANIPPEHRGSLALDDAVDRLGYDLDSGWGDRPDSEAPLPERDNLALDSSQRGRRPQRRPGPGKS